MVFAGIWLLLIGGRWGVNKCLTFADWGGGGLHIPYFRWRLMATANHITCLILLLDNWLHEPYLYFSAYLKVNISNLHYSNIFVNQMLRLFLRVSLLNNLFLTTINICKVMAPHNFLTFLAVPYQWKTILKCDINGDMTELISAMYTKLLCYHLQ